MKNHKGAIATLLTLGLVVVGTLITLGTSLFVSNSKTNLASNSMAYTNPCYSFRCPENSAITAYKRGGTIYKYSDCTGSFPYAQICSPPAVAPPPPSDDGTTLPVDVPAGTCPYQTEAAAKKACGSLGYTRSGCRGRVAWQCKKPATIVQPPDASGDDGSDNNGTGDYPADDSCCLIKCKNGNRTIMTYSDSLSRYDMPLSSCSGNSAYGGKLYLCSDIDNYSCDSGSGIVDGPPVDDVPDPIDDQDLPPSIVRGKEGGLCYSPYSNPSNMVSSYTCDKPLVCSSNNSQGTCGQGENAISQTCLSFSLKCQSGKNAGKSFSYTKSSSVNCGGNGPVGNNAKSCFGTPATSGCDKYTWPQVSDSLCNNTTLPVIGGTVPNGSNQTGDLFCKTNYPTAIDSYCDTNAITNLPCKEGYKKKTDKVCATGVVGGQKRCCVKTNITGQSPGTNTTTPFCQTTNVPRIGSGILTVGGYDSSGKGQSIDLGAPMNAYVQYEVKKAMTNVKNTKDLANVINGIIFRGFLKGSGEALNNLSGNALSYVNVGINGANFAIPTGLDGGAMRASILLNGAGTFGDTLNAYGNKIVDEYIISNVCK